jgi:hypothetical protein
MKVTLGWSYKLATTTTTKLPPNWVDQGTKMAYKVAYLVKSYNIPTTLVINIDQTCVHLVPTRGEMTWEMKGKKKHSCLRD